MKIRNRNIAFAKDSAEKTLINYINFFVRIVIRSSY